MRWVNHCRSKTALASSIPFPGQLQRSRPQLNGVSSLFPTVSQLKNSFSNGKWHLFHAAKPMLAAGKGTWKAWLGTQISIAPGHVGTALTVSSLLGGHTASQTVGLPPGGLYCLKKQDKRRKKSVCPRAFTHSHLCQALVLPSGIFRLTRDIVHWCNFHKVTPHYVQAFAATNNLQSLGKKWIWDQETHLTQQTGLGSIFPIFQ